MSRYKPDSERFHRFRWMGAADDQLRAFYADGYVVSQIARNMNLSRSAILNRIGRLHLKRNFYRRPLTARELQIIRRKYADTPTHLLARELGRTICSVQRAAYKLGVHKSAEFMEKGDCGRLRPGSTIGASFRYKRGHVPANKGTRRPGWFAGRMRETQFKKGQRPRKTLPVGTIRANAYGYLRIKISEKPEPPGQRGANSLNWEFVHKRVWEQAHGAIPKGYRIWWKDRNHGNCALANLELVSDKEHMARTTIHNLPPELKETIQLAGRLKKRIRRRLREEQTERSARSPVRDHRAVKR